ncbi:tyrosine/phenylalanine carboxypeptidase domain-containing protein [Patescibacteria group bacterium]
MFFFNDKGVLGINARNLLYVRPYNRKKVIKMADDKIKSKKFLAARGIPVPKLYAEIRNKQDLEKFDFNSLPSSFVLKPNHGFGGEGIIPVASKRDQFWVTASGKKINKDEFIDHISDILDGRYSIANVGDTAFFEQMIISHDSIGNYSFRGLPDIRVIVHNLIPVMAMLRLPTKESGGKANIHLGAVGIGIDISKGETTFISYKNKIIDEIPGIGPIKGLKIPFWDDILMVASKCQLNTNLGYMAADIVIDKTSGPVLLEINARGGLDVQTANLAPLKKRLQRIEGVKVTTPIKGVRIAKDMFGNVVEKEIQHVSGKTVVGIEEMVEIILKEGTRRVAAKLDSGKERTIIDEQYAIDCGLLGEGYEYDDEKSTVKLKLSIAKERIQTVADIEKITDSDINLVLGRRDLVNFFIDPSKKIQKTNLPSEKSVETSEKPKTTNVSKKAPYSEVDQKLIKIDEKLKLLYHLRPTNLAEEQDKFFKNFKKNPQFEYPELKFDLYDIRKELDQIVTDETPVGILFEKKREEISHKINLLNSRGFAEEFTEASVDLYGKPSEALAKEAIEYLEKASITYSQPKGNINAEEAKVKLDKVFEDYGLKNWEVKIKEEMVSDAIAGKNNRLFIRKGAEFTQSRLENLIIHEIETHILTAENGKSQAYELFNRGLANYLETQEGLAIYNILSQKKEEEKNLYLSISLVYAVDLAMNHSFVEIFEKMLDAKIPPERAWRSAVKVKRGLEDTKEAGGFTKDFLYFKGYRQIQSFVAKGGKIKDLYTGKFNADDVDIILQIPELKEPKYLPKWL